MKHYLLFCQLALLCSFHATAQFTTGPEGFYTTANTDISINGLTFRPTVAFSIENKTLTISPTALPGSPPSIARVYTFDSPITFEGRLGQFYSISELNGNSETMLELVYQNSSPVGLAGSVVNTTSHYIYNDLLAPITFSAVTAAEPGALPVTLLKFTAKKEGSSAILNWATTYESNTDFFDLEYSNNARNWNTLATISAAFQSNSLINYNFSHDSPSTGANYYRLKMVDKDQSYSYSTIRQLYFEEPYQISLYPNPTVEKFRISKDQWEKIAAIKLLNAQGNTLLEFHNKPLSKEINMKNFSAGLYVVQLLLNDGSTAAVKVIKQ